MKKTIKAICVLFSLLILTLSNVSTVGAEAVFTDIKSSDWYYSYINRLVETQITSGIGNNKFGTNNTLTRAEFVTFLDKATGHGQEENGYTFTDTEAHWAREWISAAVTANIIDKTTVFSPNKAITRQEAAEMLCRALSLKQDTAMATPFADVFKNPGYSNTAYKEYLMLGSISNNKRYFYPASTLKRSEAAAILINLLDYKADTASYKAGKKVDVDKQNKEMNSEANRYAAWKESVKGIPAELLSNTQGIYKDSIYNSYKYLRDETDYLKNWGAKYGMTPEQFENEMVRVGSKFMNIWYNANYIKISSLEKDLKSILETNVINNDLQRNLTYVKNNKFVSEGNFITSSGLLVFADWGNPILRGTIRYRYLSPTSSDVLNSEIVGSTGKPIRLGVWYEQDFEVDFYPENNGLKAQSMHHISDVRIAQ